MARISLQKLGSEIQINGTRVVGGIGSAFITNLMENNIQIMRDRKGLAAGTTFLGSAIILTSLPGRKSGRRARPVNVMRNLLEGSAIISGAEIGGVLLDMIMQGVPPSETITTPLKKAKQDFYQTQQY